MALYRRHLMEAANNQNVDIYTVEQFYETEAYAPLCETQPHQSVLPPSYEDVMAAEKAILNKYAKICTSTKCCEHSQLNQSSVEHPPSDSTNNGESARGSTTVTNDEAKPNTNNQASDLNNCDFNGNEVESCQTTPSTCCVSANAGIKNTCCRMLKDCTCVDNCSKHCNNIDIDMVDANAPTNSSDQSDENGNDGTTSVDNDSILNAANNNVERSETHSSEKCQCGRHARRDSPVEFDVLSDNGIVRMDMSKIIDRTGLPTYDAAIKLESFGYV